MFFFLVFQGQLMPVVFPLYEPKQNEIRIEPIDLHVIPVSPDFIENATIRISRALVCVQMDLLDQLHVVLPQQTAIRN